MLKVIQRISSLSNLRHISSKLNPSKVNAVIVAPKTVFITKTSESFFSVHEVTEVVFTTLLKSGSTDAIPR